jgi:hypothetical protein
VTRVYVAKWDASDTNWRIIVRERQAEVDAPLAAAASACAYCGNTVVASRDKETVTFLLVEPSPGADLRTCCIECLISGKIAGHPTEPPSN